MVARCSRQAVPYVITLTKRNRCKGRSSEILGSMLLTAHNLQYYGDLMAGTREAIEAGSFTAFAAGFESEG